MNATSKTYIALVEFEALLQPMLKSRKIHCDDGDEEEGMEEGEEGSQADYGEQHGRMWDNEDEDQDQDQDEDQDQDQDEDQDEDVDDDDDDDDDEDEEEAEEEGW